MFSVFPLASGHLSCASRGSSELRAGARGLGYGTALNFLALYGAAAVSTLLGETLRLRAGACFFFFWGGVVVGTRFTFLLICGLVVEIQPLRC